jgi:hypothetical protein
MAMNRSLCLLVSCAVLLLLDSSDLYGGGKIHVKQGYAIEADDWWEAPGAGLLWYEKGGQRSAVSLKDVVRFEGSSKAGTPIALPPPGSTTGGTAPTASNAQSGVQQPAANVEGPTTRTITGTMTVIAANIGGSGSSCAGEGGFSDMRAGKQVVVTDAGGRVIGVGVLQDGQRERGVTCRFPFTVKGLPDVDFYGIEAQNRGTLRYSRAEMERRGWTVEFMLSR